jgi:hypothetical protein
VLNACAHAVKAEAREKIHFTHAVFTTSPMMEQYTCTVSELSRAGIFKDADALELVNKMPFEPNAKVWGAFLSGAAAAGDVEHGRFVFDCS